MNLSHQGQQHEREGISSAAALIVPLETLDRTSLPVVGGKAANLITDEAAVKKLRLFWISAGDKDQLAFKGSESLHNTLAEKNIPHVWHVDSGGHTWPVWKNDLYLISQMLFRDKK